MVDCGEDETGTASGMGGGSEDDARPGVTSQEAKMKVKRPGIPARRRREE